MTVIVGSRRETQAAAEVGDAPGDRGGKREQATAPGRTPSHGAYQFRAMEPLRIGVLAVQGNFREHAAMLRRLGAEVVEVRLPEQLDGLDGLVIPGGESTAFTRLMHLYGLDEALRAFDRPGVRHVRRDDRARPQPPRPRRRRRAPKRLRPAGRVVRNRHRPGRASGRCAPSSSARRGSRRPGPSVEVLAEFDGHPVLAREGRFLVAAFHPELTDDTRLHELFLIS